MYFPMASFWFGIFRLHVDMAKVLEIEGSTESSAFCNQRDAWRLKVSDCLLGAWIVDICRPDSDWFGMFYQDDTWGKMRPDYKGRPTFRILSPL